MGVLFGVWFGVWCEWWIILYVFNVKTTREAHGVPFPIFGESQVGLSDPSLRLYNVVENSWKPEGFALSMVAQGGKGGGRATPALEGRPSAGDLKAPQVPKKGPLRSVFIMPGSFSTMCTV